MKNRTCAWCLAAILLLSLLTACGTTPASTNQTAQQGQEQQTVKNLTLQDFAAAKSREEVAQLLHIAPETLESMTLYLNNLIMTLPETAESAPASFERGVTEEGYVTVTSAELRTMITPTVITTENWRDYFEARIDQIECYMTDEDGNETAELVDTAVVDVKKDFYYDYSNMQLKLRNEKTGEIFTSSFGWGEELEPVDGKVCRVTYDEQYNPTYTEVNLDDYSCLLANGIVYRYNVPQDIVSVESYGDPENQDNWFVVVDDWYIGYTMLGEFAYTQQF